MKTTLFSKDNSCRCLDGNIPKTKEPPILTCFRGAFPPVDLRAVCLVRAIVLYWCCILLLCKKGTCYEVLLPVVFVKTVFLCKQFFCAENVLTAAWYGLLHGGAVLYDTKKKKKVVLKQN